MSKIYPLFSGSTGNCTYLSAASGSVLVDCGGSFRAVCAALDAVGAAAEEISAVLVTHEHSDHIKGLKVFLNKTDAELIASEQTLNALIAANQVPPKTKTRVIGDTALETAGMSVKRFATSHDCAGSSGYCFTMPDGRRISVCTDLGVVTDEVRRAITGSDAILLESNHDIEMLKKGPYPPVLKMRILSDTGHISNNACAAELAGLLRAGTTRFILGHLSRNNNTPPLALSCARAALIDADADIGVDCTLSVAAPNGNGVTVI